MFHPDERAEQASASAKAEPEGTPPAAGDDDPLILWFLSLTPTERVEIAQDFVASARLLRDGLCP